MLYRQTRRLTVVVKQRPRNTLMVIETVAEL